MFRHPRVKKIFAIATGLLVIGGVFAGIFYYDSVLALDGLDGLVSVILMLFLVVAVILISLIYAGVSLGKLRAQNMQINSSKYLALLLVIGLAINGITIVTAGHIASKKLSEICDAVYAGQILIVFRETASPEDISRFINKTLLDELENAVNNGEVSSEKLTMRFLDGSNSSFTNSSLFIYAPKDEADFWITKMKEKHEDIIDFVGRQWEGSEYRLRCLLA